MVNIENWTIKCNKCGVSYDIPKEGKITVLNLKRIKFQKKPKCPVCGYSSSIATLKHYIGYNNFVHIS